MKDRDVMILVSVALTFGMLLGISIVLICAPEMALFGDKLVCKSAYIRLAS